MSNTGLKMTLVREPVTAADVVILGCVSGKRRGPSMAKDLYDSPLFAKRRRYAEGTGKPWVIFSAEHGILAPEDVIEWYDVALAKLPVAARRLKGIQAIGQLESRFGSLRGKIFEIHAGRHTRARSPLLSRPVGRGSSTRLRACGSGISSSGTTEGKAGNASNKAPKR